MYKKDFIKDIEELKDNLDYLKKFIEEKLNDENELDFFNKTSVIHTEIQLLKNKLKYKK